MPVLMELSRIILNEINDQQIIFLKEIDGERTFPIVIGIFEATSIDRRVKGYPSPRPLNARPDRQRCGEPGRRVPGCGHQRN